MKPHLMILSFLVVCLSAACEKEKSIQITDIQYAGCDSHIQKIQSDDVTLEYKNNYLYITHENAMVNCGFTKVNATITTHGDTIEIIEQEDRTDANCICYTDISYKAGPIDNGSYTIIIKFREEIIYNQIKTF